MQPHTPPVRGSKKPEVLLALAAGRSVECRLCFGCEYAKSFYLPSIPYLSGSAKHAGMFTLEYNQAMKILLIIGWVVLLAFVVWEFVMAGSLPARYSNLSPNSFRMADILIGALAIASIVNLLK